MPLIKNKLKNEQATKIEEFNTEFLEDKLLTAVAIQDIHTIKSLLDSKEHARLLKELFERNNKFFNEDEFMMKQFASMTPDEKEIFFNYPQNKSLNEFVSEYQYQNCAYGLGNCVNNNLLNLVIIETNNKEILSLFIERNKTLISPKATEDEKAFYGDLLIRATLLQNKAMASLCIEKYPKLLLSEDILGDCYGTFIHQLLSEKGIPENSAQFSILYFAIIGLKYEMVLYFIEEQGANIFKNGAYIYTLAELLKKLSEAPTIKDNPRSTKIIQYLEDKMRLKQGSATSPEVLCSEENQKIDSQHLGARPKTRPANQKIKRLKPLALKENRTTLDAFEAEFNHALQNQAHPEILYELLLGMIRKDTVKLLNPYITQYIELASALSQVQCNSLFTQAAEVKYDYLLSHLRPFVNQEMIRDNHSDIAGQFTKQDIEAAIKHNLPIPSDTTTFLSCLTSSTLGDLLAKAIVHQSIGTVDWLITHSPVTWEDIPSRPDNKQLLAIASISEGSPEDQERIQRWLKFIGIQEEFIFQEDYRQYIKKQPESQVLFYKNILKTFNISLDKAPLKSKKTKASKQRALKVNLAPTTDHPSEQTQTIANPTHADDIKATWCQAVQYENWETLNRLLEDESNFLIERLGKEQYTILHWATTTDNAISEHKLSSIIEKTLSNKGRFKALFESRDSEGNTALALACKKGRSVIAHSLLCQAIRHNADSIKQYWTLAAPLFSQEQKEALFEIAIQTNFQPMRLFFNTQKAYCEYLEKNRMSILYRMIQNESVPYLKNSTQRLEVIDYLLESNLEALIEPNSSREIPLDFVNPLDHELGKALVLKTLQALVEHGSNFTQEWYKNVLKRDSLNDALALLTTTECNTTFQSAKVKNCQFMIEFMQNHLKKNEPVPSTLNPSSFSYQRPRAGRGYERSLSDFFKATK